LLAELRNIYNPRVTVIRELANGNEKMKQDHLPRVLVFHVFKKIICYCCRYFSNVKDRSQRFYW